MADIKGSLRRQMNSGHRPPNLTVTSSPYRNCASCIHYRGYWCKAYEYNVRPSQACDSWEPLPK